MKQTFKKYLKKVLVGSLIIFSVLFIFRLLYGYTKKVDRVENRFVDFNSIGRITNNYATKKYKVRSNEINQGSLQVDQKYEKIAEIKTKSADFDKEEMASRRFIKELNALVQFEQKSGNSGERRLDLIIGVPPDNFDALYNELISIGRVQSKQITKKDKTNEYKELNAKKQSLEKTKTSLINLKAKGGKIEEFMDLENRILEIEQQLQGLGVSLGDYDDENEFCTVQFSLQEGTLIKIGAMQRVKVALEWSIKMYLRLVIIFFFLTLFTYIIILIVDKLKLFNNLLHKTNERLEQ